MFMYVTFAVNAMRIFGNNRKIIGNNWTISQELWNRIIGKILSIIASGLIILIQSNNNNNKKKVRMINKLKQIYS